MATKSYLTREQYQEASSKLVAPSRPPDGDERRGIDMGSRIFSRWLGEKLLERLSQHADWEVAQPVILGSWAREELSPKSDIDLMFLGPEERVKVLVNDFSREGIKLRYRVPLDPADWTKGVEPFDILALFSAVPLSVEAREKLDAELARLGARKNKFRRELLKAMRLERKTRAERFDSVSEISSRLSLRGSFSRSVLKTTITRLLCSRITRAFFY
jgi:[protein-PII] uridylyltransferase